MGMYEDLALAIVRQAVEDYRELEKVDSYSDNDTSKQEMRDIVKFLDGEWCDRLLYDFPMSGKEIIKELGGY